MKSFLSYFFLFLLCWSCGTPQFSTYSPPSATHGSDPPMPLYPSWDDSKGESSRIGIGPVSLESSNFYFSGKLQVAYLKPTFWDCATGEELRLSTSKGVYMQLAEEYDRMTDDPSDYVFGTFRGYFINEPLPDSPKKLVITYIDRLQQNTDCPQSELLTGKYTATFEHEEEQIQLTVTLTSNYEFTCEVTSAVQSSMFSGNWFQKEALLLNFIYTSNSPYFNTSANFLTQEDAISMIVAGQVIVLKQVAASASPNPDPSQAS